MRTSSFQKNREEIAKQVALRENTFLRPSSINLEILEKLIQLQDKFKEIEKWREGVCPVEPENRLKDGLFTMEPMPDSAHPFDHVYRPFQFNNTAGYYNSSTIVVEDLTFLALRAPIDEEETNKFYRLLKENSVTDLVRLTPVYEKMTPANQKISNATLTVSNLSLKTFPYWHNALYEEKGQKFLKLPNTNNESMPQNPIRYYDSLETWRDMESISAEALLQEVLKVRKHALPNSMIAVHCHSGVGRTGTFIAAYVIIDKIEKAFKEGNKIAADEIHIDKVVCRLSLQRLSMVSPKGYLVLHEAIKLYASMNPEKVDASKGKHISELKG